MDQNFPGCREVICEALLAKGVPRSALDTTLASISQATISQYAKPIKLWWTFCRTSKVNCLRPSVSFFLEFLSAMFSSVGSYSTLNTYRSAISLICVEDMGSHPMVKRFFRGVAALKPQKPRYEYIWNPAPVIAHLASLYPHDSLSLEVLSRKLVTLLALTSAQRMQTLAAIQRSNIIFSDILKIRIPARLKTSGIGKPQPLLIFKPFNEKPELCVFSLVRFYLQCTNNLRCKSCDSFFISTRAPYNPVSPQTLGRWVKTELNAAGIDTSIFSAHSTRHASTSLAAKKGVNIDEIRRTAGWTNSSDVFARFYNRLIVQEPSFLSTILDTN